MRVIDRSARYALRPRRSGNAPGSAEGPDGSIWLRLVEALPDGVLAVDDRGVIRYSNERLHQMSGYSRHEIEGMPIDELVPAGRRASHAGRRGEHKRPPRRQGTGASTTADLARRDGTARAVDISVAPLDVAGARWTVVALRDDVERRRGEGEGEAITLAEGRVLGAVAGGKPLTEILASVLEMADACLGPSRCSIFLLEDGRPGATDHPQTRVAHGVAPSGSMADHRVHFDALPPGPKPWDQAVATRCTVIARPAADECWAHLGALGTALDAQLFVAVPIPAGPDGPILATMVVHAESDEAWERARDVVDRCVNVAAVAIAHARNEQQSLLRAKLLDAIGDAVVAVDREQRVTYWNPTAARTYGWSSEEAIGRDIHELVSIEVSSSRLGHIRGAFRDRDRRAMRLPVRLRDGTVISVLLSRSPVVDEGGREEGAVVVSCDLGVRNEDQAMLARLALYDPVVDLPNRSFLLERLSQALERQRAGDGQVVLVVLNLDRFGVLNDSGGHAAGDELLRAVGARLAGRAHSGDTVASLGGDEFAVFCECAVDAERNAGLTNRLEAAFARPFAVAGSSLHVTVSGGVTTVSPGTVHSAPMVLAEATAAMRRAKQLGGNRVARFEPAIRERTRASLDIEMALPRAMERGEVDLHYQPQVRLADGEVVGVEALARWDRPGHGLVPPGMFIPVAEGSGLIVPLGARLLEQACRDAAAWSGDRADVPVSVNFSAHQLVCPGLVRDVSNAIEMAGITADRLTLEVTETALVDDVTSLAAPLRALRKLGVGISIDDFGTGYSSLTYLRRLPVTSLKIDLSFIAGLGVNAEDEAIVDAIIRLAGVLGIDVVAEGVETDGQLEVLRSLDCPGAQGYLFAPPMPMDRLQSWMNGRG